MSEKNANYLELTTMNIKRISLLTAITATLLFGNQALAIEGYSRKIEAHTENYDAFNTDAYVNFERNERSKKNNAKKQAFLNYLFDTINIAYDHFVEKESEFISSSSEEDKQELEDAWECFVSRKNDLSNELNAIDNTYAKALSDWEKQYRIDRANALRQDALYVFIHFRFNVRNPHWRPPFEPELINKEEFDINENFDDIDRQWILVPHARIIGKLSRGYKSPGWSVIRERDRSFQAHFWQVTPSARHTEEGGRSVSTIDITLTLKYTDYFISNRINEEIKLCKQNVK